MNVYFITLLILIFYLVLAWIVGPLIHLTGATLWLLRGSLMLLGVVAAGLFLWFHHRLKRGSTLAPAQFAGVAEQLKLLLRQAEQKLTMGKQGSLGSLPIVFVLGDLNSAKTSSMIHSGLDPELIAGHVYRDSDVVPTATINIWFARKTVFIEAGGQLAANPQLWAQVLRQTRPKSISAAVGKGQQAPRAALVCVDTERLSSSQAAIQNLANRLKEMARSLGAPFPVYVLFTKLDRLPHFADFVSNLAPEESAQILGATLPRASTQGVFAEEENKRLTRAFDQIIYSLAEKRLDFLSRETLPEKAAGIYEFPRELRKNRNQVVQLLVDLTRPTQLSANPFLRGFYFSGVRAVLVNEAVSVPAAVHTAAAPGSGATRMFNFAQEALAASQNVPQRTVQSRKVPEWAFLPHLFTEIVLADRVAFSASHQSTRVDRLRRGLLASVAVLLLAFSVALLVSFVRNRILENNVAQNALRLNAISAGAVIENPSLEQLQQLDQMRGPLATLSQWKADGPPLSYRFGLYTDIYPQTYSLYFQNFRRLLLGWTQARMVGMMRQLPDSPLPSDLYAPNYDLLKAYLITTSYHDKSTQDFLSPELLKIWSNGRDIDPARLDLARTQFEFFSQQLPTLTENLGSADSGAVEHTQRYLKQFKDLDRLYQALLSEAGKSNPSINFNRLYPDARVVVSNGYEVPGAFTKGGYLAMQEILKNPAKYFGGEKWVLGESGSSALPVDTLKDELRRRYLAEFANRWSAFLNATVVPTRYSSFAEASSKLKALSGPAAPLLQLFSLVTQNTSMDSSLAAGEFQPTQLVAPSPQPLIGAANQPYMSALLTLQSSLDGLATAFPHGTTDPSATAPVQQNAVAAKGSVGQIAQSFHVDSQGHVDAQVRSLMERPINAVQSLLGNQLPGALNGAAADMCSQFRAIAAKYPFNSGAKQEATVDDLKFFQLPAGTLWSFYDTNLKPIVQRQGTQFTQNPNAPVRISPQFLSFLSRAALVADALFPQQSPSPHASYVLKQVPNKGTDQLNLAIDGKTLSGAGHSTDFEWPGSSVGATLTGNVGGSQMSFISYPGLWGAFHFLQDAKWTSAGGGQILEWPIQFNGRPILLPDGSPLVIRYELQGNLNQLLHGGGGLEGLHCPPLGAH